MEQHRAFTLIELLVVIAIIGLLSSVVLASLNSAREKSRDARRLADIQEAYKALQFHYDEYGEYPIQNYAEIHNISELEEYLNPLPDDPLGNDSQYFYYLVGHRTESWITSNSWSKLTTDCANKYVLVIRNMETDGDYRQDCDMTADDAVSIVLDE